MVNVKDKHGVRKTKQVKSYIRPCMFGWTTPWIEQSTLKKSITKTTGYILNKSIKEKNNISKLRLSLKNKDFNADIATVKILQDPFQICVIENFISNKDKLLLLYQDIQLLEWNTKKMDLYELYQSPDLSCIFIKHLTEFYNFLKTDVQKWLTKITGLQFTKVSATCSMYNATNYLLPHDDLLEDRLVAFVFYICPWKLPETYSKEEKENGWSPKMGGNLKLFAVNEYNEPIYPAVDKIPPKNNQFLFFKVNSKSYHEVEEVFTTDYSRISINGWFHGPKINKAPITNKTNSENFAKLAYEINDKYSIQGLIEKSYLTDNIKKAINAQIEQNSEISLDKFLSQQIYDSIARLFMSSSIKWKRVGPVNKCNYEVAFIGRLYNILYSDSFISLLRGYTDLNLPLGDINLKKSLINVEIQRWTSGCYTVIHDKSEYDCDELDLILYINCVENSTAGAITYLDPGDEEENVLLTIYPKNNSLNIVYRTSGTTRFTKYVNHKMIDSSQYFYIISCKYKEVN